MDRYFGFDVPDQPLEQTRRRKFFRFTSTDSDQELIPNLSEEHRAILLEDGTYNELASRFGIALGTVCSRLHHARAALESLRQDRDLLARIDGCGSQV